MFNYCNYWTIFAPLCSTYKFYTALVCCPQTPVQTRTHHRTPGEGAMKGAMLGVAYWVYHLIQRLFVYCLFCCIQILYFVLYVMHTHTLQRTGWGWLDSCNNWIVKKFHSWIVEFNFQVWHYWPVSSREVYYTCRLLFILKFFAYMSFICKKRS